MDARATNCAAFGLLVPGRAEFDLFGVGDLLWLTFRCMAYRMR